MRYYLLVMLVACNLTGCLYYGDIHGQSKALTEADLTRPHRYPSNVSFPNANWWEEFNDPQLNQLINIALNDSPTVQAAAARIRKAENLAARAATSLWPTITSNSYVLREKFAEFGTIPPPFNGHTFDIGSVAFNFNYEIDFWGKNRQTLAARVSEICAAEGDTAQARLIISAAVANAYFQLLGNIEQVNVARANLRASHEIAKIVLDRAKNGISSDIPVISVLSDEQTATLNVEQYKQAVFLAQNQLAALLGKNPLATKIITRHFNYHASRLILPTNLPAHLLAQRPDILAAKARAEAAAHQINVAKAYFFPDINLTGLFSYQSVGLGHLFDVGSQNNSVSGTVDLPLFDAGARRANLGVQYAEYDVAVNDYNQTILNALHEVADQLALAQTIKKQLQAQDTVLKQNRRNYKLFNSRYNHGIVDYEQVLEIKELLLQQQATQINLQIRHLQAVVAMRKALGGNFYLHAKDSYGQPN